MAFTAITTAEVDPKSPMDESLWAKVKDNFDDHESRITSLAGASLKDIEIVYDGSSPTPLVAPLNGICRIKFPTAADKNIRFLFAPGDVYTAGNHIKLKIEGYCDSTGNVVFKTVSTLIRDGDDFTALTNQNTNSQTIAMPGTANDKFSDSTPEVSTSLGQINSLAVTATSNILVELEREGTNVSDTATGSVFITRITVDLDG